MWLDIITMTTLGFDDGIIAMTVTGKPIFFTDIRSCRYRVETFLVQLYNYLTFMWWAIITMTTVALATSYSPPLK